MSQRLDLQTPPKELSEQMTATVVPETVNLDITVTDPDPETAQLLAQTTAEELTTFVDELETPRGEVNAPIKLTIVEAAPKILPALPERLTNAVMKLLEKHKVEVVVGERVTEVSKQGVTTATGRKIQAELPPAGGVGGSA